MIVSSIPRLLTGFVDDAAVFPPGNAPLPQALSAHHEHRAAWYADLVGPLLVPTSRISELPAGAPEIGVIGDSGLDGLDVAAAAAAQPPSRGHAQEAVPVTVRQVEISVAKRGEDPLPGLRTLIGWAQHKPFQVYAELPLTWGCVEALDLLAEAGHGVRPKFRTGGLAAELFPSPEDLASVLVACAERELRFKLTAGLHHAVRHTDRTTGFTHHGFLNVLVACEVAARGDIVPTVAGVLTELDPDPLIAMVRPMLHDERPLWAGFGTCSVSEPLDDLVALGLLTKG